MLTQIRVAWWAQVVDGEAEYYPGWRICAWDDGAAVGRQCQPKEAFIEALVAGAGCEFCAPVNHNSMASSPRVGTVDPRCAIADRQDPLTQTQCQTLGQWCNADTNVTIWDLEGNELGRQTICTSYDPETYESTEFIGAFTDSVNNAPDEQVHANRGPETRARTSGSQRTFLPAFVLAAAAVTQNEAALFVGGKAV